MEMKDAVDRLGALAQETRLGVFRLLVQTGPDGLAAGDIAEILDVSPSTMSFHLAQLEQAGLLRSHRVHRQIIYAADYDGMRRLLGYLVDDCCQGRPEICTPMPRSPAGGKSEPAAN